MVAWAKRARQRGSPRRHARPVRRHNVRRDVVETHLPVWRWREWLWRTAMAMSGTLRRAAGPPRYSRRNRRRPAAITMATPKPISANPAASTRQLIPRPVSGSVPPPEAVDSLVKTQVTASPSATDTVRPVDPAKYGLSSVGSSQTTESNRQSDDVASDTVYEPGGTLVMVCDWPLVMVKD